MTDKNQIESFFYFLLFDNEQKNKYPEVFIEQSTEWAIQWLFGNDDFRKTIFLQQSDSYNKEQIMRTNLAILIQSNDSSFLEEVEKKIKDYEGFDIPLKLSQNPYSPKSIEQKNETTTTYKNAVQDSNINADGNVHIGDKINIESQHTGSGDIVKGDKITNNYYNHSDSKKEENINFHVKIKRLITNNNLKSAIKELLIYCEQHDQYAYNKILNVSGRYQSYKDDLENGVLTKNESKIEENKIRISLISFLDGIKESS